MPHVHQLFETPETLADAVARLCVLQADALCERSVIVDVGTGRGRLTRALHRVMGDRSHRVVGIEVQEGLGGRLANVTYGLDALDASKRWPVVRRGDHVVIITNPPFRHQVDVLRAIASRATAEEWASAHVFAILGSNVRTPSSRDRITDLHLCAEWAVPRAMCMFDRDSQRSALVCAVVQHMCTSCAPPPVVPSSTPTLRAAARLLQRLGGADFRLATDQYNAPVYVKRLGSHARVGDSALVPEDAKVVDHRVQVCGHGSLGTVSTKLGTAIGLEPHLISARHLHDLLKQSAPTLRACLSYRSSSFTSITVPLVMMQLIVKKLHMGANHDGELDGMCECLRTPLSHLAVSPG